jgi:hypothetical protein
MRTIFLIAYLFPAIIHAQAFGQSSSTFDKGLQGGLVSGFEATTNKAYSDQYQAVYDVMVAAGATPSATDASRQNLLVQRGIDHGWWDELDYFSVHAIHSNSNGIHLLNWVLPAGGSNVVTNRHFSNA